MVLGDTDDAAYTALRVESTELRHAANRLLEISDTVQRTGQAAMCDRADRWGSATAAAAGDRFAGRFSYLLSSLSREVEDAGYNLRGSADVYDEVDLNTAQRLNGTDAGVGW